MEGSKMLGSGVIGGNIYQGCFCGGQRYLVAFVILSLASGVQTGDKSPYSHPARL